jgi:hypothetical protein
MVFTTRILAILLMFNHALTQFQNHPVIQSFTPS